MPSTSEQLWVVLSGHATGGRAAVSATLAPAWQARTRPACHRPPRYARCCRAEAQAGGRPHARPAGAAGARRSAAQRGGLTVQHGGAAADGGRGAGLLLPGLQPALPQLHGGWWQLWVCGLPGRAVVCRCAGGVGSVRGSMPVCFPPWPQALRQHLEASHDYFEFAFADDQPDLAPEVALRCRRGGAEGGVGWASTWVKRVQSKYGWC